MKVTAVETRYIHIRMTEDEAEVLQAVLYNVSGEPSGPRRIINKLTDRLDELGVETAPIRVDGDIEVSASTILP